MSDPSADRPQLFTKEDVEALGDVIDDYYTRMGMPPSYRPFAVADLVLRHLAAADRLLPVDAFRTDEWTYTYRHAGDGQLRSGEDGGELYESRVELEAQFAFWAQQYPDLPRKELRCVRRDVFTGPWVADDGSAE